MALAPGKEILERARREGYAVGSFTFHSLDMIEPIVRAAEAVAAPVLVQTTYGGWRQLGLEAVPATVKAIAEAASVPVVLHLDHTHRGDQVLAALDAGFTSVMLDASDRPFEANAAAVAEVVRAAHARRVPVEAELGRIGGVEDQVAVDEAEAALTDPEEAERFVAATGCDFLAVAIGTAHGMYRAEPRLALDRLAAIAGRVAIPLVLHGGSGVPDAQVRQAIALGVAKINVATELKLAWTGAVRRYLAEHPDADDPRKLHAPAREAVAALVRDKLRVFGAWGRA